MRSFCYEILLGLKQLSATEWRAFFEHLSRYLKIHDQYNLVVRLENNLVHYYLKSPRRLPSNLGLSQFLLKACNFQVIEAHKVHKPYPNRPDDDFFTIMNRLEQTGRALLEIKLYFYFSKKYDLGSSYLTYYQNGQLESRRLLCFAPLAILSSDFLIYKAFNYQKIPQFLSLKKILPILSPEAKWPLLSLDVAPHYGNHQQLSLENYDFWKSTLVLGRSGSGKSRFLAYFVNQLYHMSSDNYKVVIIDPHHALWHDLGEVSSQNVIDFRTNLRSIDLFAKATSDINVSVELILELVKTLINGYNGKLERVLRYAVFLLLAAECFSLTALRRLVTDLEYRQQLLSAYQATLPSSVVQFFATDFNELRIKSYNEAIAPLIAFLDEMQMVSIFNNEDPLSTLQDSIENNFLTVFSLDRSRFGHKVTQMIAGLLFQQIFILAQQLSILQHLIVIIDEVPVIENPILARFLAELRKYQVSVILAGQHIEQFSRDLQSGIWANVPNYFVFHVSKNDAEILAHNLDYKLVGTEQEDDKTKIFTSLHERECIVQLSSKGRVMPAFKARTLDYNPPPAILDDSLAESNAHLIAYNEPVFEFNIGEADKPDILMRENSTNRKKI